jgi:hypothetical protein
MPLPIPMRDLFVGVVMMEHKDKIEEGNIEEYEG